MATSLKGRNLFALEDFTPKEIRYLLGLAVRLKKESEEHIKHQDYIGKDFLLLFEVNSTRTRCTFETPANDPGMGTTFLSDSHFGNTETIKDSMRVFSEMYNVIEYRGAKHSTLLEMAKGNAVPIINGYTDHQHPTQILAGVMTLDEVWGRENYRGKTPCFIGRGGAVDSFSCGVACAVLGMNLTYITSYVEMNEALEGPTTTEKATFRRFIPEGMVSPSQDTEMDARERKTMEDLFAKYNPQYKSIEADGIDAIKDMDVITTENRGFSMDPVETWLPGIVHFRPYQVNGGLLEHTKSPDCITIHMLPSTCNMDHAPRQELLSVIEDPGLREFLKGGMEVADGIFERNTAYIFQGTGNRKHTIKAVIKAMLGKR